MGFSTRSATQVGCTLLKYGAQVLANVGSGCDAMGHSGCTSGLVGWQLSAPGLKAPIGVLPSIDAGVDSAGPWKSMPGTAIRSGNGSGTSRIAVELFVDQQICELFLHDGRGNGSAVVTFGCTPSSDNASGIAVIVDGVEGASMSGRVSDMADSILPPPQE